MKNIKTYILSLNEPFLLKNVSETLDVGFDQIEAAIEELSEENLIRKRMIDNENQNEKIYLYWTSRVIQFTNNDNCPLITSPFDGDFDHKKQLDKLTDQQISQEKIRLKTEIRKVRQDIDYINLRAKKKFLKEDEEELEEVTKKWLNVCQDGLYELQKKLKERGQDMSMNDLIKKLRINPKTVKWNEDDEDFETI